MIYSDFKGLKISKLGFGTMRLSVFENDPSLINEEITDEMIKYAIENGINYFDTAYPYHNGKSEIIISKLLKKYPRENYFLATKYPGHQISSKYDPSEIFETQLKKCKVEYFDFYLLHNVYENSIKTYLDPKWNIIPYFIEQKRLGRIKHLGFSSHAGLECLKTFLDLYGSEMEFCQIQLNYLDWTLQEAKQKYDLVTSYDIPIWVMEPLRGGKLISFPENNDKLFALRPNDSIVSWGFNFLLSLPNVKVILSGMSNMDHMISNINIFNTNNPLSLYETNVVLSLAEELKHSVPCTKCGYCLKTCPKQLNIPFLINAYNDLNFVSSLTPLIQIEALEKEKLPDKCIRCGICVKMCPQKINIPQVISKLDVMYKKLPSWESQCRIREELAKKLKNE